MGFLGATWHGCEICARIVNAHYGRNVTESYSSTCSKIAPCWRHCRNWFAISFLAPAELT